MLEEDSNVEGVEKSDDYVKYDWIWRNWTVSSENVFYAYYAFTIYHLSPVSGFLSITKHETLTYDCDKHNPLNNLCLLS